ncbi:hypothetical protein BJX99DRAFT_262978 [Aspergillus californicus]
MSGITHPQLGSFIEFENTSSRIEMELTFVVGQAGQKAKRSRRACTPCRRKKKRCSHGGSTDPDRGSKAEPPDPVQRSAQQDPVQGATSSTPDDLLGHNSSPPPQVNQPRAQSVPGISNSDELDTPRFLSYTSPLVALQNNPRAPKPRHLRSGSRKGDVGAWSFQAGLTSKQTGQQRSPPFHDFEYSGNLPPKESQVALVEIFFARIHPLLPLIDEGDTRHQFEANFLSLPLLQSICLVAAKDRNAAPFLLLGSDAALLPVEKFGQQLYKDILQNMPRKEDGNRFLIIQILALLSLHEWGPSGSEDSSLTLTQAIHHAWSLGLHLHGPNSESSLKGKALFWCLWSLDKWNSVVDGRPVLFHDYDHGQKVTDALPLFTPPFRVWLLIADELGRVISAYRPRLDDRDRFAELPLFEEFVETAQAWDTEPQLLESLEFYYYATVILGTYSSELQGRHPSRGSRIHQSQAILALAAICRRKDIHDFSPLPVSAYTLSLAFSITYRQLQKTNFTSHRALARENLLIFHQSLKSLCSTWWLAAVMVHLGTHALESSERPPAAAEERSEQQLRTSQSNDVPTSRPPIPAPGLPSINYSTSHDPSYFDATNELQGHMNDAQYPLPGTSIPSDIDHLFGNHDLSTLPQDSFETFFENFLDVNFPTCLTEQSLGGYNAL